MNSTPSRCSSIIRLTALPPPPPTPTTFIRAFWEVLSSNSKIIAGGTPNEWREGGPKFGRNIMLSLPKRARDDRKAAVSFFGCVVGSSRDQVGWRGAGIAWWASSLWGTRIERIERIERILRIARLRWPETSRPASPLHERQQRLFLLLTKIQRSRQ